MKLQAITDDCVNVKVNIKSTSVQVIEKNYSANWRIDTFKEFFW